MKILSRSLPFHTVRGAFFGMSLSLALMLFNSAVLRAEESAESKAREVIEAAIDAMGGDEYRNVNSTHSYGRYFQFMKGQKSFAQYNDWTVFKPVKWRFQQGKGKNQYVMIYNLEKEKGWTLEGRETVEEIPEDSIERFRRSVKEDLDMILRYRLDEEGMNLFYYGPNDIAGQGKHEAVEFLDMTNKSVVVFFDRQSHLPAKVETHSTDQVGVRHKEELELSNWHDIQGVKTALRFDFYVDGEVSWQRFLEGITFDPEIPPEYFLEPVIEKK
jgi:hypothetical protein